MLKRLRLGQRTIRVRLTSWYVLLLGLTLALFSSYLYLQLKRSLLAQLDTALKVTASEILNNLIEDDGQPAFKHTENFQSTARSLVEAGFAVRLIDKDGTVWDSLGNYRTLPPALPTTNGYTNRTNNHTIWRIYSQKSLLVSANGSNSVYWLQVAQPLAPVSEALEHLLTLMLVSFPLVLLVAWLGGLFLSDKALDPIDRITRTAQAISASDFTQRINYQGPVDEVARLAITLDRMLDRLQAAFEQERRFTANASHELRTPLTVIKGRIGVTLARLRTPAEYEITLQDLETETDRLIRLTHDLLFLAKLEQKPSFCQRETVDLSNLLTVLVEQMQPLAEAKQITLVEEFPPELFIQGHPNYLISLFSNLLDNAIKYTLPTGRVTLQAQSEENKVLVAVHDTGVGISKEHLPHVFERFYRVEGARSRSTGGAGLGLAIAYEIVRLHSGSLTVESQLNQGTIFTVSLP